MLNDIELAAHRIQEAKALVSKHGKITPQGMRHAIELLEQAVADIDRALIEEPENVYDFIRRRIDENGIPMGKLSLLHLQTDTARSIVGEAKEKFGFLVGEKKAENKKPTILDQEWTLDPHGDAVYIQTQDNTAIAKVEPEYADVMAALPNLARALVWLRDNARIDDCAISELQVERTVVIRTTPEIWLSTIERAIKKAGLL